MGPQQDPVYKELFKVEQYLLPVSIHWALQGELAGCAVFPYNSTKIISINRNTFIFTKKLTFILNFKIYINNIFL